MRLFCSGRLHCNFHDEENYQPEDTRRRGHYQDHAVAHKETPFSLCGDSVSMRVIHYKNKYVNNKRGVRNFFRTPHYLKPREMQRILAEKVGTDANKDNGILPIEEPVYRTSNLF